MPVAAAAELIFFSPLHFQEFSVGVAVTVVVVDTIARVDKLQYLGTIEPYNIVSNLYSASDFLIHEISFAYITDLQHRDVNISLDYQLANPSNRRMRCRLLQGDQVGLNLVEKPRRPK